MAGPRRPQDRVPLTALRENFRSNFPTGLEGSIADLTGEEPIEGNGRVEEASAESFPASDPPSFAGRRRSTIRSVGRPSGPPIGPRSTSARIGRSRSRSAAGVPRSIPGSVAIAAITSCTNTSNPTVMVGAGLLARNAVARGLRVGPTVKTSLAPARGP